MSHLDRIETQSQIIKTRENQITHQQKQLEEQTQIIATQHERIKELECSPNKNSKNSSKPPSTGGYKKPSPKSLLKKSDKTVGGQPGHQGNTLKPVPNTDEIV